MKLRKKSSILSKTKKVAETISYLKPSQAAYQVLRRFHAPKTKLAVPSNLTLRLATPQTSLPSARKVIKKISDRSVELEFLSECCSLDFTKPAAWNVTASRLWLYNLHYCSFLLDSSVPAPKRNQVLLEWFKEHQHIKSSTPWEPYPVSVRLINILKFYSSHPELAPVNLAEHIWTHRQWLLNRLEKHVLANHFLKNLIALTWSELCLDPSLESNHSSLENLLRETRHQFCTDGLHYERSPMYHIIMLELIADSVNLFGSHPRFSRVCGEAFANLVDSGSQMLRQLLLADNRFALFGDSVLNQAIDPQELLTYCAALRPQGKPSKTTYSVLTHSGYAICASSNSKLIAKLVGPEPSYQPGHSHCDIFSYELQVNGTMLICDTGVYSYEADAERHYARSTRAHNTIEIDGTDQSEIWGSFRIGRRARVYDPKLFKAQGARIISARHDGFRRLPGRPQHERTFKVAEDLTKIEIIDRIKSRISQHDLTGYVHIAPKIKIRQVAYNSFDFLKDSGELIAQIEFSENCSVATLETPYWPRMGQSFQRHSLQYCATGLVARYTISEAPR